MTATKDVIHPGAFQKQQPVKTETVIKAPDLRTVVFKIKGTAPYVTHGAHFAGADGTADCGRCC